MRFQFKYGFYFLYLFFSIIYIIILSQLPLTWKHQASVLLIYSDPAILGLFFLGAIILLEKSQQVLSALAIAPITITEYILAKVVSLGLIAVLITVIIGVALNLSHLFLLCLITFFVSILFSLIGLIGAARTKNLNHYLIFTVIIEIFALVPPLIQFFIPTTFLKWYPLCQALNIMQGDITYLLHTVFSLFIMIVIAFNLAYVRIKKMFQELEGAKI